jgi:hypothetical protein
MPLSQAARKNGATISPFNRALEINPLPSGEWEVVSEKGHRALRTRSQRRRLFLARGGRYGRCQSAYH